MRFKKILFPTDFSKHSLYALPYAKDLVSQSDGELYVVHVVDDAYQYMMTASEVATVPVVMPLDGMRKTAQHQIQELQKQQLGDLGDRVHTEVVRLSRSFNTPAKRKWILSSSPPMATAPSLPCSWAVSPKRSFVSANAPC